MTPAPPMPPPEAPGPPPPERGLVPRQAAALRVAAIALGLAALAMLSPHWAALILAAWFALLARPLHRRLARLLRGRPRIAAALVLLLLLLLLVPVVIALVSLSFSGVEFVQRIIASKRGAAALAALASDKAPVEGVAGGFSIDRAVSLFREHGAKAWQVLRVVTGATANALVGLFIFLFGFYTLLVGGPAVYAWAERHAPLAPAHLERLAQAFNETGRGLIIGVGLTALTQGVVATVTYLSLRVPSALVLGLLTGLAAMIPSVGTALVWLPLAAGLAITGRWIAALVLAAVGIGIIGTVDNLLRPLFSRFGQLRLPAFLLFIAIFGGLALLGTWGLILGPLTVRLAIEVLAIAREEGMIGPPGQGLEGEGIAGGEADDELPAASSASSRSARRR